MPFSTPGNFPDPRILFLLQRIFLTQGLNLGLLFLLLWQVDSLHCTIWEASYYGIGNIFVYGVRKCSSFILLQVVDQFFQNHLLKRLSFLHCIFLPPLSLIGAWIYLWAFYFVPLIFISVFVPVPYCPVTVAL